MSSPTACVVNLVVLIGCANAFQPKQQQPDVVEIGDVSNPSWAVISPGGAKKMKTKTGEYHRAAGVPRGECTHRLKPTLLFIGQAYSGSTSLSDQMALHPELSTGDTKEHRYFKPDYHRISSEEQYERYLDEFWVSCNVTVAYDATMDYLPLAAETKQLHGLDAVKYVHQRYGSNVKIMVMLRDPVDLMFHIQCSQSLLSRKSKNRPFTIDKPHNCTRDQYRASLMLDTWLKVFPKKSRWLFLSSDEYFQNPQKVLQKVFKFAGVKPMTLRNEDLSAQNGRRRCNMKATSEERKAYWSVSDNFEDLRKLEKLTGLRFYWHTKA